MDVVLFFGGRGTGGRYGISHSGRRNLRAHRGRVCADRLVECGCRSFGDSRGDRRRRRYGDKFDRQPPYNRGRYTGNGQIYCRASV